MSARLINRFGQTVTVRRDNNGESYTKGKRDPDVWTEFTITASVQPIRADEITQDMKATAERNRHAVKVYSATELKTVDEAAQRKADRIVYEGEEFEVIQVHKQLKNRRSLQHYKVIAQLVNNRRVK